MASATKSKPKTDDQAGWSDAAKAAHKESGGGSKVTHERLPSVILTTQAGMFFRGVFLGTREQDTENGIMTLGEFVYTQSNAPVRAWDREKRKEVDHVAIAGERVEIILSAALLPVKELSKDTKVMLVYLGKQESQKKGRQDFHAFDIIDQS